MMYRTNTGVVGGLGTLIGIGASPDGLGAVSPWFGKGCDPNAEPTLDEVTLLSQIDAIPNRMALAQQECLKLEGPGRGGCMGSVAEGYAGEGAALAAQLQALCQSKSNAVQARRAPTQTDADPNAKQHQRQYMIVGGVALVLIVAAFALGRKS
jgi:hypothetical protein